ncbi:hypothetical protein Tco_1420488 [Tanacetum coccineum]
MAITASFDSLVEIIKQKKKLRKISDTVASRRACFTFNVENFRIIHKGKVIHSPQIASVGAISQSSPNNNLEDSFKWDEDLNFIPNKELDKEVSFIPRESNWKRSVMSRPFCDDFQSFKTFSNPLFEKKDDFPSRNDESILKEEVHKETLKSYLNPLFEEDEEIISIEGFLDQISPKRGMMTPDDVIEFLLYGDPTSDPTESKVSLMKILPICQKSLFYMTCHFHQKNLIWSLYPKDDFDNDDDLFEMNSNYVEWKDFVMERILTRMDYDSDKTKIDFDKSSSNVFKSLSDEFEPGGSSYVEGNNLVCYEEFHISDALFSTINEDKVFNPGILVDKNSKVHEPNVLPTLPTCSSEMMLDFDLENFQVEPKNDILNPKVLVFDPGIFDNVLTRKSSLTLKIFDPPSIIPPFIRTNSLVFSRFDGEGRREKRGEKGEKKEKGKKKKRGKGEKGVGPRYPPNIVAEWGFELRTPFVDAIYYIVEKGLSGGHVEPIKDKAQDDVLNKDKDSDVVKDVLKNVVKDGVKDVVPDVFMKQVVANQKGRHRTELPKLE